MGFLQMVGKTLLLQECLQSLDGFCARLFESQIHVDGKYEFGPGNKEHGAGQELEQGETITSSRHAHEQTISCLEHLMLQDRLLQPFP